MGYLASALGSFYRGGSPFAHCPWNDMHEHVHSAIYLVNITACIFQLTRDGRLDKTQWYHKCARDAICIDDHGIGYSGRGDHEVFDDSFETHCLHICKQLDKQGPFF
jgi:hypothetical protein